MSVIEAKTIEKIRSASYEMLKGMTELYDKMYTNFVKQPVPTYDNLRGNYEELWCNYRNKVIASVALNDKAYVYHAASGAQDYLDEMTRSIGTKKFDMMKHFDADNLVVFKETFLRIMDEYLEEYKRVVSM